MADLDTRSKRASGVNFLKPYAAALVLPDGTLGTGDRQHTLWDYSGILAGVATHATTGILIGAGALIVGAALHVPLVPPASHSTTGVLRGASSQLVGTAVHAGAPAGPAITQRSRFVISTKQAANIQRITFDFAAQLIGSDTMSAATNTIVLYSGDDPGGSLTFVGSPTFSGTQVSQSLSGGLSGCTYLLVSRGLSVNAMQTFLNTFLVVL